MVNEFSPVTYVTNRCIDLVNRGLKYNFNSNSFSGEIHNTMIEVKVLDIASSSDEKWNDMLQKFDTIKVHKKYDFMDTIEDRELCEDDDSYFRDNFGK